MVSLVNRRCLACAQQGQGALAAARRLHTSSVPRIALSPLVRAADASSSSAQQQQQQQPQESFKDKLIRGLGFLGGFYTKKHVLGRSAQSLYSACVDQVNAVQWKLGIGDFFLSFFLSFFLFAACCCVLAGFCA